MDTRYIQTMENSINNKTVLMQFIDWTMPIIDVGSSTGALTFELATMAHRMGTKVYSLEPDNDTYERLKENVFTFDNVIPSKWTLSAWMDGNLNRTEPCNIVLSSVMHHMIKYFHEAHELLNKLFAQLPSGSRVLVRDGVRPSSKRENDKIGLICNPQSLSLAKEFFVRWKEWHDDLEYIIDGCTVWGAKWLITELMLTITWGSESMPRECYEHYTVLAIEDYIRMFEKMGYITLYAESIIQEGYYDFLPKLGRLINENGYEIPLPFTNQILCFEKK